MSNILLGAASQPIDAQKLKSKSNKSRLLLVLFGICLPVSAICFELTFRICAQTFFDPFPSNFHVLLFALIPLSNMLILIAEQRDMKDHYAFLCLLNGMASGLALTYTLMFLPILPASLVAVLLFGFGLLGLSPALGLMTSLKAGGIICSLAKAADVYFDPEHSKHLGHLLIIASIVAIELPSTLTRIHLHMAAEPATAREGIDWLRHYGSEEVMLRACYERSGKATDILGSLYESGHPLPVDRARQIFYKVTGKPFNAVGIPMNARAAMQHAHVSNNGAVVTDEFDVDTDVAGEKVSGVARGLALTSSSLNGVMVPGTASANVTWSLGLKNDSPVTREARSKIILPAGAAVNRIRLVTYGNTLTAHLKLRQAARSQYRRSAASGEDPLLISYCGPDEILMQCTPIRPGMPVTILFDMVVPLTAEGVMTVPFLEEHNFSANVPLAIDIASANPITSTAESVRFQRSGADFKATARLNMAGSDHLQFRTPLALNTSAFQRLVHVGSQPFSITETLKENNDKAPANLIVVVDGSASMAGKKDDIAQSLHTLPDTMKTQVITVTDETADQLPTINFDTPLSAAIASLQRASFAGGQNDILAVKYALQYCAGRPDTAVLWLHNAQPIEAGAKHVPGPLDMPRKTPILFDYQLNPGPNELLTGVLNANTTMVRIPASGDVYKDLSEQAAKWAGHAPDRRVYIDGTALKDAAAEAPDTIDNVTTLWALNKIMNSDDSREQNFLADKFNLLTPISSAIVHDPVSHQSLAIEPSAPKKVQVLDNLQSLKTALSPRRFIDKEFEKVTGQLNSLSSGAGYTGDSERKSGLAGTTDGTIGPQAASSPASPPVNGPYSGLKQESVSNNANFRTSADEKAKDSSNLDKNAGEQNEFVSDADEAATAPEPETWLLLCVVAAAMVAMLKLGRRKRTA